MSWGADVGWYLSIAALVLVVGALVMWIAAAKESWGGPAPTRTGTPMGADIDRLIQLKALVDSGHITNDEFQQVKVRILGAGPGSSGASPTVPSSPADDLQRLKKMHDSGIITDAEYDELRKRAVGRL